jgi:hypothetical protein
MFDPEVEDLISSAIASIKQAKAPAKKAPSPEASSYYTSPDNWKRTRGVVVVHEETGTLLGNFGEWVHIHESGTRKLIAESAPISVMEIERVSGDWWIAPRHEIASPESWHEKRVLFIPVQLDCLAVQSPAVEVSVHLAHGGIVRVELIEDTMFAQIDSAPEQLLHLPKGVNILPVMGRDCRIALRVELGKEEE